MFSDPQTVVISTVSTPLPRVAMNGRSAVYEAADGNLSLTISHSSNKRNRSVVRIDRKKIGADALNPATNRQYTSSVYLVVDYPITGIDDPTLKGDIIGLADYLKASTNTDRILGQES